MNKLCIVLISLFSLSLWAADKAPTSPKGEQSTLIKGYSQPLAALPVAAAGSMDSSSEMVLTPSASIQPISARPMSIPDGLNVCSPQLGEKPVSMPTDPVILAGILKGYAPEDYTEGVERVLAGRPVRVRELAEIFYNAWVKENRWGTAASANRFLPSANAVISAVRKHQQSVVEQAALDAK